MTIKTPWAGSSRSLHRLGRVVINTTHLNLQALPGACVHRNYSYISGHFFLQLKFMHRGDRLTFTAGPRYSDTVRHKVLLSEPQYPAWDKNGTFFRASGVERKIEKVCPAWPFVSDIISVEVK